MRTRLLQWNTEKEGTAQSKAVCAAKYWEGTALTKAVVWVEPDLQGYNGYLNTISLSPKYQGKPLKVIKNSSLQRSF